MFDFLTSLDAFLDHFLEIFSFLSHSLSVLESLGGRGRCSLQILPGGARAPVPLSIAPMFIHNAIFILHK